MKPLIPFSSMICLINASSAFTPDQIDAVKNTGVNRQFFVFQAKVVLSML